MKEVPSKIIIIGGGPVGLTAAHSLSKAGLDFVLLEGRPEIVSDAGSGLVLSAMGMRGLGQLGLLPALNEASTPVDKFVRFDHKGREIGDTLFFTYIQQRSVRPIVNISLSLRTLNIPAAMVLCLEYSDVVI